LIIDLDFKGAWTPAAGGSTDLEFGLQPTTATDTVGASMRIQVSAPTVRIRAAYDNLVSRKLDAGGRIRWQRSDLTAEATQDAWSQMTQLSGRDRGATALSWDRSQQATASLASGSRDNVRSREVSRTHWEDTDRIAQATTERFDPLWQKHERGGLHWGAGEAFADAVRSPFVWLLPCPNRLLQPWQSAVALSQRWQFGFAHGVRQSTRWGVPWEMGRQPQFGESHWPVDPPVEAPQPRVHPNLDFICRAAMDSSGYGLAWRPLLLLDFGVHPCPRGRFSVPILKVYFVSNSVDIVRLPGREPIPVKSIQIAIDTDSWAWGFSANLPTSALELIEPTSSGPVEIEISINGVIWVMLVEGFELRREFGQASLGIRGRSRAAYLAEPYAPKRSFVPSAPFTARQLAEQELTRAGLVTGFDLDWRLPDWLVPEGSWSVESLSPMGAIGCIVESVGGYVSAHTRLKMLVAKSRYPELPWNWARLTPDRSLPIDVVKMLSLRWQEKPFFNAVVVSGQRQGVTGHVIRSGTAGDAAAPMVVDGLITHADAARERGRAILADTGKQAMVTLELPMLRAVGLLDPGLLIAVGEGSTNWRGLVRATSIAADWSESLTVRQTIEVERHYL
jgi:hypothetical protein